MGLTVELNVCGNRVVDLLRVNQIESLEVGLEVNSINKERRRVRIERKKDFLCREEKELYKSYLIRNLDGVFFMRKIYIVI